MNPVEINRLINALHIVGATFKQPVCFEAADALAAQQGRVEDEWHPVDEQPFVSAWRWILFWHATFRFSVERFHVGDNLPVLATHWRFVDPPAAKLAQSQERTTEQKEKT